MLTLRRTRRLTGRLGPGLITGAADDDPSGLATYSQAGTQFGSGLLWTLTLTTPLMVGIQMVSARIGWLTGQGLAANICRAMPRPVALALVGLLVVANVLNIAADIAAMGQALQLAVGGLALAYAVVFGVVCAVLPVVLNYESVVRVLKWLTLALLAYVGVVLTLHVAWLDVLRALVMPSLQWNGAYWQMIVAVLGTTISPYLFFWQAAQEAELRQHLPDPEAAIGQPHLVARHLRRIRIDTTVGMVFSNAMALCVMLATAVTLHAHGITEIQTTRDAALALRPIAGEFAFVLFAFGIVGTGLLAVPVLAGSAAYAVADVFHWRSGLDRKLTEARGFYAVLITATALGTLVGFTAIDPIKALLWSAMVNGVVAVPIMVVMMRLGSDSTLLGEHTLGRATRRLGWAATAVMAAAVGAMAFTW